MKITVLATLAIFSYLQFSLAVALLWGIDAPIVVAIATLAIAGPLTYVAERSKPGKKSSVVALRLSAFNTIFASMLAMHLNSLDVNHYHSVFYAVCVAAFAAKMGVTHAMREAIKIVATNLVDTLKRIGLIDKDE